MGASQIQGLGFRGLGGLGCLGFRGFRGAKRVIEGYIGFYRVLDIDCLGFPK